MKSLFKAHLRQVKKIVGTKIDFWGVAERQQDIDTFSFYQPIVSQIPNLIIVIRKTLSGMSATATNKRTFNVLNIRRCRLAPVRTKSYSVCVPFQLQCTS